MTTGQRAVESPAPPTSELTADLEQAREQVRSEKEAHDVTLQVMQNAIHERDAARRDIGRYGWHLSGCAMNPHVYPPVPCNCGFLDAAGIEHIHRTEATTPTADPRDAVVSAAREWVAATSEVNKYTRHQPLPLAVEDRMTEARTALRHAVQDIDAAATPARGESDGN